MARIIAVENQKGGVGKTTTAVNLAASLAHKGRRVLLVDFDPQGSASIGLDSRVTEEHRDIYQTLIGKKTLNEIIIKTAFENLYLAPTSNNLSGAEIELVTAFSREGKLKILLNPEQQNYDFILIDCPPSLGLLTVNALTAAHSVLIPLQCEYYAMEGLSQLLNTVELIKKSLNTTLAIEGILLTMYDKRNNLSIQVAEEIAKHFSEAIFKTIIPRNVRLSESPSFGKPVIYYDLTSTGAQSYLMLADEFIERYPKMETIKPDASMVIEGKENKIEHSSTIANIGQ